VPTFEGPLPKKKEKRKRNYGHIWTMIALSARIVHEQKKGKRNENADPLKVSWAIPLLDEKETVNYWFRSNERNSCREGLEFVIWPRFVHEASPGTEYGVGDVT
jgi:hypothetical protein